MTAGTVTEPNSQERIEALAATKSHGARFLVTGGGHMCTDNIFKAMELKAQREKQDMLKKDKALCVTAEKVKKKHWQFGDQVGQQEANWIATLHYVVFLWSGEEEAWQECCRDEGQVQQV